MSSFKNHKSCLQKVHKYVGTEREAEWWYVVNHSDDKGDQGKTKVTTITWQTCIFIQTVFI